MSAPAKGTRADEARAFFDEEVLRFRRVTRWGLEFMRSPLNESSEDLAKRIGMPDAYSDEPFTDDQIEEIRWMAGEVHEHEDALHLVVLLARQYRLPMPDDLKRLWASIVEPPTAGEA